MTSTVVVLSTGGTIAGRAAQASDAVGYTAGSLGPAALLAAVPALAGQALECHAVAALDSKDMDHATWQALASQAAQHLARPDVAGVVVTHGTDTLEETAWFLHRVLAPAKPLVLTAAMRPASHLAADGPQNLLDAVALARCQGAQGVLVALAGAVHGAAELRKAHPYRVDAFDSGDSGPLALVEEGVLRPLRPWPQGTALGLAAIAADPAGWPVVDIVFSGVQARAATVAALRAAGAQGLVVAATGNGTVHHALEAALQQALGDGLPVLRASRCGQGRVVGQPEGALPSAGGLNPAKARVELMLRLLAAAA
jgi:L-asparaginase